MGIESKSETPKGAEAATEAMAEAFEGTEAKKLSKSTSSPEDIPKDYEEFAPNIQKLRKDLMKVKAVDEKNGSETPAGTFIEEGCRFYQKKISHTYGETTYEIYVLSKDRKPVLKYMETGGEDYMYPSYHSAKVL